MASLFNAVFVETFGETEVKKECRHFARPQEENFLAEETVLIENSELRLYFQAPPHCKLYMDGLDQLSEAVVFEDERGLYIRPSDNPVILYNPKMNNKPYPFIPGTYFLLIADEHNREWQARMRVTTKRITEQQHEMMVEQIEQAVKGLSTEAAVRRKAVENNLLEVVGIRKIHQSAAILSSRTEILASLQRIQKKRRFTVKKEYPVMPRSKAKRIDEKSIKYLMMHPEQQKTIQAPVSTISYDLPENRWIKQITSDLLKEVIDMKAALQTARGTAEQTQQAEELKNRLIVLQQQLAAFLNLQWVRELPDAVSGKLPMTLFTDGDYHTLYKMHRLLKNGTDAVSERKWQFHYKRSDLLYEIWGYLRIVCMFTERFGYTVEKDWFSRDYSALDEIASPNKQLPDYVELAKDGQTLRIFYDELIPNRRESLSSLQTMYTMNHNKPDCRIDVWQTGKYKGSLIVDFKYRKREYLWDDNDLEEGRQPAKVMRQLESYASGMKSFTKALNGEKTALTDAQPVTEVWAAYPVKWKDGEPDYELNDYAVRLIDLSPGEDESHFAGQLRQAVDEILAR